MPSTFLGHNHADKNFARQLAHDLKESGVTVWIDEAALGIGDSLVTNIGRTIDSAEYLGVLLSTNSVKSEWVLREVEIALNSEISGRKIKVLPLLLDNCQFPASLRGKVLADFRDPAMYQCEFSKLLNSIGVESAIASGTTTVMFDESFNQDHWFAQPLTSAGYSTIAQSIAKDYSVKKIKDGYSDSQSLPPNGILILPTPFGVLVDEEQYKEICKWINRGGRLLFFGFYLMETHHYSNLNNLARRLGLEFSHNLTMPKGRESFRECMDQAFAYAKREYWIHTQLIGKPSAHPLLDGINTVVLTSSCTIESSVQPDFIASTSVSVAVLLARGHKNPEGRLIQLTDYVLDKYANAPVLCACKYGNGRVVALGTWKVFINEMVEDDNDNMKLFHNVISWLAGQPE
jgi:hypothetical protein